LNQSDNVSTPKPVSYSDIPERNIFDTRYTGSGKTSSALQYISEIVGEKRPVIVLMQSYERLENNYHSQFDPSLQARTLIFKGKTQTGMCTHSSQYQKLWEEGKTPKNECETCPDSSECAYQKQIKLIEEFKESKQGFCILTTDKNLNKVLSGIQDLDPVLIIDDISLSSVIMPEITIETRNLEDLVHHLHKQGSRAHHLYELAQILHTLTDDNDTDLITYISLHARDLQRELLQFQIDHNGKEELPGHPALSSLYHVINTVKTTGKFRIYSEYGLLKIVTDESAKYKALRICYLNATPSLKDTYCMEQILGDYYSPPLTRADESKKKYVIFQIPDSANARSAVRTSKRLADDFRTLVNVIKDPLKFTEQKLLLFSFNELFGTWAAQGVLSGIDYTPEIYFGSGTRGTNDYKDYPISFVIGNPNLRPEYFLHPAFEKYWKSEATFNEEKKKDPFAYRVDWEVSKSEARVNLLQMIGRNLRDSPNNPDAVKVVVVFSDIDIKDDCKKQNGGTVIRWYIRNEIPVIQGKKKGNAPIYNRFKRACQEALKPHLKKKIGEYVDKMLNENHDDPVQLQPVATMLHEQIKIYGEEGIKKDLIKEIYDTDSWYFDNNGKRVNTAFIIKKKSI